MIFWNNNNSIFADFEEQIQDNLQETINKFEKTSW